MLIRLFPTAQLLFLGVFAFNSGALAATVCDSIPKCQEVMRLAAIRIHELSDTNGQRVSTAGAIFTRVTSATSLEDGYRDPSGLIWATLANVQGKVTAMNKIEADSYCSANGARLPTKEEFDQLAVYLGSKTAQGYSPYLAVGKVNILPGLSDYRFWTSSRYPLSVPSFYVFQGYLDHYNSGAPDYQHAVMCVSGP